MVCSHRSHRSRLRGHRLAFVLVLTVAAAGCTSPEGDVGGVAPTIPTDKALVTITYQRGVTIVSATTLDGIDVPAGCVEANPATHVVTYLSFLQRDTVLIDTVDWRDEETFDNALFAPSGDAWVYVATLHASEGEPGVVLSGTRLEEPVTLVGGEAVELVIDLDALAPVTLAWSSPADPERPWTGGPNPYSYEPFDDHSEAGIQMEASLPWPTGDDLRAPAFGWENVVSFSTQNPTGEYYVFEVWESGERRARNLVRTPEDYGTFGVSVNGLGFNGASLAFPNRNFYTLQATCTRAHTFIVPQRP